MNTRFEKISGYWQPVMTCVGSCIVAIATLNEGEHSIWNLLGAGLAAFGALAAAFDQARSTSRLAASVTGGESFIFLEFVPQPESNEFNYIIAATHQGKDTVQDLTVSFVGLPPGANSPGQALREVFPSIRIGNIVPNSKSALRGIAFANKNV